MLEELFEFLTESVDKIFDYLGGAIENLADASTTDTISVDIDSVNLSSNLKIVDNITIDADSDGRFLGVLVQSFNQKGIAYLVDRDHDGEIDSIQIDYRNNSSNLNSPADTIEYVDIKTFINNSNSFSSEHIHLLSNLVALSIDEGGEQYAKAIPNYLIQILQA